MASSSSVFNFLSFLLPSQISKKNPPPQIISTPSYCDSSLPNLSSSTTTTTNTSSSVSFLNRRNRDGFVPITPIQKSSSSSENENENENDDDVLAVVCPSLAYSNILYCSPYQFEIYDEDEPVESLILRFRRSVLRAGVIQEAKRRRFHENSQEKKKRKSREAARRNKRSRTPWRGQQMEDEKALKEEEEEEKMKKAKDDDLKDNWEYSEGGIPYY